MKRLIALILMLAMLAPIGAKAQDRNWWTEQICEDDEENSFTQSGAWPGDVVTHETIRDVIVFRPKVVAAQKLSKSVKVLVDATTASRSIVVKYTVDGKTWTQRSYRNIGYKAPVICTRKWQCVLHKNDTGSSWCVRQFKQGNTSVDYKKVWHPRDYMAQLYFDDYLIDGIRKKVPCAVMLNIPACAKTIRIRYVYTGFKKTLYSEWMTVKVR